MQDLLDATFPAATDSLAQVRARVAEACARAGCGDECTQHTVLAVNEACMNVIQHGYRFGPGQFRLQVGMRDGSLAVRVLDNGIPVSEADLRPRGIEDLRPGGLGVHFMREVTDAVQYLPPPPGWTNLLQLLKRIY